MTQTRPVVRTSTRSPAPSLARERLDALLDPGWEPLPTPRGGPVLTGVGRVHGTPTAAFATDPAVKGGALGSEAGEAVEETYRVALGRGLPVVGLWHSAGARIDQGVRSLDAMGRIFHTITSASGRVPQVSVVLGPAAGAAAYGPALTDVVVMAPEGRVFVTGPDVVRMVTGEDVGMEDLGGPALHAKESGVCHVAADSAHEALITTRTLVDLLARGGVATEVDDRRDLGAHLPLGRRRAYDMGPLVHDLLDVPGVELHRSWAPNVLTVLGRLGGRSIGVVANNPLRLGGCLDSRSAEKAARFVRMCDAFGLPLVSLVDVPGYLPGLRQESEGVVRRGAKLLHAFAGCSVPRASVIVRRAYGGAYIAMSARSLGSECTLAWPDAEVAVMGPEAAVRIVHRRALDLTETEQERRVLEEELLADQRAATTIQAAVEHGVVQRVVEPVHTRHELSRWLGRHDVGASEVRGRRDNTPL